MIKKLMLSLCLGMVACGGSGRPEADERACPAELKCWRNVHPFYDAFGQPVQKELIRAPGYDPTHWVFVFQCQEEDGPRWFNVEVEADQTHVVGCSNLYK